MSMETAHAIVTIMMQTSDDWALDEPSISQGHLHHLEELTDSLWSGFARALADQGIYL